MKNDQVATRSTLHIYQVLKERIQNGDYPLSYKFNQTDIAQEFGVSRMPVIKALGMLEADELVDNIPQRGYFIHEISIKNIIEIYQLRNILDVVIIDDIFRHITPEEVEELEAIFLQFKGQASIDRSKYIRADMEFHNRLYEISHNHTVARIQQYMSMGYRYYKVAFAYPPEETLPEHLAIVDAIRKRDVRTTTKLLSQHSQRTLSKIEKLADYLIAIGRDPEKVPMSEFELC